MAEKSEAPSGLIFTNGDLWRLVVPLIIEQLLMMTVGMADIVMVTSLGEAAVSAVSLVDSINSLIVQVFSALSTGGAVVVAQYLGRREADNAKKASKQVLYIMAGISVLLMAIAFAFRQGILVLLFGQVEQVVMQDALVYFLLTAAAYPFMGIYNAGAALFRAAGNSKVSMFCSFVVNLVNISVNAVLIYLFRMGTAGAGIGTLLSRVVAAVIVVVLLKRRNHVLHLGKILRVRFHKDMVKRILIIGVPNGLENGMFQIGKLLTLGLITSFGTVAVAANAIAGSIASLVNIPGMAIGLASITVVGRCMGAGAIDQAVFYTKRLVKTCYLFMAVFGFGLYVTASFWVGLFHLNAETATMAAEVLRICAVGTIFIWPLAFTLPNSLRASGDALYTMVVSQCSMFACRVILSYVFACAWGLNLKLRGVCLAMIVDWAVRAIFFEVRFRRGKWKSLRLIG